MSTQTVAPSATPTADFEQHVEAEYRDALGRAAGTVYYDSLGHRRVVTAPMFEADNGTVTYGHEAEAASTAHFEAAQAEHKRVLARLTPSARRAYGTHLRTRCLATPVHAPAIAKPRPRGAGRPRARTATRSSAKSGDSGTDSDESEPPRTAPCACGDCDRTVSPGEGATHPACRKRSAGQPQSEPSLGLARTARRVWRAAHAHPGRGWHRAGRSRGLRGTQHHQAIARDSGSADAVVHGPARPPHRRGSSTRNPQ